MKLNLPLLAMILAAIIATPSASLAQERSLRTLIFRTASLPVEGMLPSLGGATGWLNSEPLMPERLRGKVVVVDFWTYTCINWQRTQPYVRAWHERYKDQGLVVIGVHSPEFEFEKIVDNIRPALKRFRVDYPVAIDSDFAVCRIGACSATADSFSRAFYFPGSFTSAIESNSTFCSLPPTFSTLRM